MPEIHRIDLYRREPFTGEKIRWISMPQVFSRISPIGDLWRLFLLTKNARTYDVIIGCHQRFHGVYAAIAGFVSGTRVIQLVITEPAIIEQNPLTRWALSRADAIGFRGTTTMNRYRTKHGNRKPYFVPNNIITTENPSGPPMRKTHDLLYVGNCAQAKNIPAWIQVASEVKHRRGTLAAKVVGNMPDRKIMSQVSHLGLEHDIEFTGPLYGDDLDRCYAQSKIFLLTSLWEGLPMVALEATLAGLPVVSTHVGDMEDLIENGVSGYLTPVGNISTSADAVIRLLENQELYAQMSDRAIQRAQAYLEASSLDTVIMKWRSIFTRLSLIHPAQ